MDDLALFAEYDYPPEYSGVRVRDVPAEMVVEIAKGMEEPEIIAARYNFTPTEYTTLENWPPYQAQLEAKKAELREKGVTFKLKMAYMAEDLGSDIYVIAKSATVTLSQKLETFRTMARLADLEPKTNQSVVSAGTGFSISINLNGAGQATEKVIDQATEQAKELILPVINLPDSLNGNPPVQPT